MKLANGIRRNGMIKVTCEFDEGDFEEIKNVARRYKVSFIEAVRMVAAWGLESDDEGRRASRNPQGGATEGVAPLRETV